VSCSSLCPAGLAAIAFSSSRSPIARDGHRVRIRTEKDADRASDVVDRIGALIKKTPPGKEVVDLNAAILEVTALTQSEAVKSGVTLGTQLAGDLPRIRCDRVQPQ
jgi:signal transduction histidine kinase